MCHSTQSIMIRTGIGFDSHRFAPGRQLVLGGVIIDSEMGLQGHSDADVLSHAISDSLLGAVAEGDIGRHFPDTDKKWKDADSLKLLQIVTQKVRAKQAVICNIDATIMAEVPKISPYVDDMREKLANAVGIEKEQVSVKATTMEGMGAIGRREGIAVMAVATISQDIFEKKNEDI